MRRLTWLALVLVLILALRPQAPARAYVTGNVFPILFLHGFASTSADDCGQAFALPKQYFGLHGWRGALITLGYYSADTNCDVSIVNWSALHDTIDHCAAASPGNEGTNNEDLRHVACELAWYIYDNWGVHGWNADIVAHSMGGLIARQMLASAGPEMPPKRYVQDVFTTGTPHGGMATALPCGCTQAQEMLATDTFLATLTTSGQNPQGSAGTDWTLVGSDCDSNTALAMDGGHKTKYHSPCYTHPSYYDDTSAANDALVNESTGQPRNATGTATGGWPHSLHLMNLAMNGQGW